VRTVPGDYMRGGYWLVGPSDSTDGWKNWVATPVATALAFRCARRIAGSSARGSTRRRLVLRLHSNIAFFNPTRGTYLQTYYYYLRYGAGTTYNNGPLVAIGRTEMDMLKAEALDAAQPRGEAIPLINKTRIGKRQAAGRRRSTARRRRRLRAAEDDGRVRQLWDALATRSASRARASTAGRVLGRARLEHAAR
jgi:hypothetical protein